VLRDSMSRMAAASKRGSQLALFRWRLVHQTLPLYLLDRQHATFTVRELASVPAERKLIAVSVQVFWRYMVESANHARA